ncbi:MAG: succinylglutamate desuccinylase/aspartoacylase family protein [Pseudobdellovibrionaceae bacterium]|nr:succinylglutamate desuccinylase/aspartoacylase family protein [Bdellovibrionales bacterium]USN48075.1 MAG: succinylglutamate desuccinylase/aspartoacylase family protein [Pseudobdellovibrionaceae bacterium]
MKSFIFGQTSLGLPIVGHRFGSSGPKVLILGGVHGDESEGVIASGGLVNMFYSSFTYRLQLTLIPMFNTDGVIRCRRKNAQGVDLNRNLPTNDWTSEVAEEKYFPGLSANSEPENQALVNWLDKHKPQLIISLHSWKPLLNTNGNCQPEAEIISKRTGYEIKDSIGYPTPGCLGTYCGLERDMPTLTYEIQRELPAKEILKIHVPAIAEALKTTEDRF